MRTPAPWAIEFWDSSWHTYRPLLHSGKLRTFHDRKELEREVDSLRQSRHSHVDVRVHNAHDYQRDLDALDRKRGNPTLTPSSHGPMPSTGIANPGISHLATLVVLGLIAYGVVNKG